MIIAVDTGGTKTLVARLSDDGVIEKMTKFATPNDFAEYAAVLVNTISHLSENNRPGVISVALPGYIKDGVALRFGNLPWRDVDMRQVLQKEFHHATVLVENDANLAGLGEAQLFTAFPASLLYVTISTGIGTALISQGVIDPALKHSEGGHMILEWDGKLQKWEDFASGRAMHQTHGKFAKEIDEAETWREIARSFSVGFLALIPTIQPEIIVIGGSVGTHFDKYGELLTSYLSDHLSPLTPLPQIQQARNPEEAVIHGCYHYAKQSLDF